MMKAIPNDLLRRTIKALKPFATIAGVAASDPARVDDDYGYGAKGKTYARKKDFQEARDIRKLLIKTFKSC